MLGAAQVRPPVRAVVVHHGRHLVRVRGRGRIRVRGRGRGRGRRRVRLRVRLRCTLSLGRRSRTRRHRQDIPGLARRAAATAARRPP